MLLDQIPDRPRATSGITESRAPQYPQDRDFDEL